MNSSKARNEKTGLYEIQSDEINKYYPLEAVSTLIFALKQNNIRYCHWKSNSRLDWGLTGRTDLDLLVDQKHEKLFKNISADLKIKKMIAPTNMQYPSLEHYLGFDPNTGNLFHLHIHFQLVVGEQYVKNYRIPIENKILDLTQVKSWVNIPIPELEIVILSIRALLKYRNRYVLKDILLIRSAGFPEHILHELIWLFEQTSIKNIGEIISEISIFSDENLILEFLNIVKQGPRSGWKIWKLRTILRRELRAFQRQNRFAASLKYFFSLFQKIGLFNLRNNQLLKFPNGGKLIAIVGIDGSGKSTLCGKLTKWLEWKVTAPLYYMGS